MTAPNGKAFPKVAWAFALAKRGWPVFPLHNVTPSGDCSCGYRECRENNEACEYLGAISRPTLYRLMGNGDICFYHINRRRFCLKRDLDAYIENCLEEERYT